MTPHSREAAVRETVDVLSALTRTPCSRDEATAADWLAERLRRAGARVALEPAHAPSAYAPVIGGMCALGGVGGLAMLAGRRRLGALLALAAAAGIVDDASNGPRVARRLLARFKPTQNVVAQVGRDDAPRTVVVVAHHDSAPTGLIFDQTLHHKLADRFPEIIERTDTAVPIWWPVPLGSAVAVAGALLGSRRVMVVGTVGQLVAALAMADIARSPTVPGANDNAASCGILVALAEALAEEPAEDVRVLLLSCGAEEVLQGGIHAFAESWFGRLDRASTSFLVLETVGCPHLILVEGEGPFRMEDYADPGFRDRIEASAADAGIALRRGMRSRASTDAVVPSRAGYPTACLASMDSHKALSNYHLMSDTPDNLCWETIGDALALSERMLRAA